MNLPASLGNAFPVDIDISANVAGGKVARESKQLNLSVSCWTLVMAMMKTSTTRSSCGYANGMQKFNEFLTRSKPQN